MQKAIMKILLTAVLCGFLSIVYCQTIELLERNGFLTNYSVEHTEKIIFFHHNLELYTTNNSSDSYKIYSIRKLTFTEGSDNSDIIQFSLDSNFSLYPVLATDHIQIQVESSICDKLTIEIFTAHGGVVYNQTVNSGMLPGLFRINIAGFSNGIYLCRISADHQIRTLKFMKY